MKIFIISLLLLSSCTTQRALEKKIDREVDNAIIPKDVTPEQNTRNSISRSNELSENKKNRLLELQVKTKKLSIEINDKIARTKIILLDTVLERKMSYQEFNVLKRNLLRLEKNRVDISFKALNEARNIINPVSINEDMNYYRPYLHYHFEQM